MREFDLIQSIVAKNDALPDAVTIPPGDDMAAIELDQTQLLVAVDQVIHGVHFDPASATIEQIGRKAVTRNLSDVAAMAAWPVGMVACVQLPRTMSAEDAKRLLDAVRRAGEAYDCPLIGGDTSIVDGKLSLSITVFARPDGVRPVTRRGAAVGDAIYVTGQLGGSLHAYDGKTHHLDFEPRLTIARQLAGDPKTRPTAMIDLSDGLARDLPHLIKASQDAPAIGADIDARCLPVSAVARQYAVRDSRPGWMHAVADGEDYELLFTAKPEQTLPEVIDGVEITRIGTLIDKPGITLLQGGDRIDLAGLGWEHHA